MIKVSVMYPSGEGSTFDMDYYLSQHLSLVRDTLGASLKGATVDVGLGGAMPRSAAPYIAIGHLIFDSLEVYQAAFAAHGMRLLADIPNYTNTRPVMQASEMKV